MKANEAPENVYLAINAFGDIIRDQWQFNRLRDDDIEYTRTDAFIKKACEVFCKVRCNGHPPRSTCTSLGTCIEYDEFKKAMQG